MRVLRVSSFTLYFTAYQNIGKKGEGRAVCEDTLQIAAHAHPTELALRGCEVTIVYRELG